MEKEILTTLNDYVDISKHIKSINFISIFDGETYDEEELFKFGYVSIRMIKNSIGVHKTKSLDKMLESLDGINRVNYVYYMTVAKSTLNKKGYNERVRIRVYNLNDILGVINSNYKYTVRYSSLMENFVNVVNYYRNKFCN